MKYVLACLSHGEPESPYQRRTFASAAKRLRPVPTVVAMYHDGPGVASAELPFPKTYATGNPLGFCRATAALWTMALRDADTFGCDHVFWLEHDFVFLRDVNVDLMAAVLKPNPDIGPLAQVQLMRQPVNARERAAGGLYESRPGEYRRRRLRAQENPVGARDEPYLTHRSYFTTNPSLMSVAFMAAWPFPVGPSRLPYDIECEGRYGIDLVHGGYQFAVMGDGEPWVEHIGVRDGEGY